MECAHCGYGNRPQAVFCARCGQPLKGCEVPAQNGDGATEGGPLAKVEDGAVAALAPGEILAGRYEVVEVLEEEAPVRRCYRARDWGHCAVCGATDNPVQAEYCVHCGAALDRLVEVTLIEEERQVPQEYTAHFSEGGHVYYVLPAQPALPKTPRTTWWEWRYGAVTDAGRERDHNEDYLSVRVYAENAGTTLGFFLVADGLGGQDSGEVASRLAAEVVWENLRESIWLPILRGEAASQEEITKAVCEAVERANERVCAERAAHASEMSTTLAVALAVNADVFIANVGDSRAYRWGAKGLERITRDHSLVQRLLEAGHISPQEVYTHPQRNVIYHSIGDQPLPEVDVFHLTLETGDELILCTDGLWEMVREEGLEEVLLAEPDPQRACERLIEYANLAGGEDNISVIVAQLAPKTF